MSKCVTNIGSIMPNEAIDLLKQIRKCLDDIRATLVIETETYPVDRAVFQKAVYQVDLLRKMMDTPPDRRHPWSYYRPFVAEEFGSADAE